MHNEQGASYGPRRSRRCIQHMLCLRGRGRNPHRKRPCLLNGGREPLPAAFPARAAQNSGGAGRVEKCPWDCRGFPAVLCCCLLPNTATLRGPVPPSRTPLGCRGSGEHHLAAACQIAERQQPYPQTALKELVPNGTKDSRSGRTSRRYPREIRGLLPRPSKQPF